MDERKILYSNFLKDKRIYNLNVSYWRVKLQKDLEEKINSKEQLVNNKNSKGKSYFDGNPIFSYYYKRKEKAIRIIQEDPDEIKDYKEIKLVAAWIDKILIPLHNNDLNEIPELVISVFLTKSSVDKCLILAKLWFQGDLNETNIEANLNS